MELFKKARTVARAGFTRMHKSCETELADETSQLKDIQVSFALLTEKAKELAGYDKSIFENMVKDDVPDDKIAKDVEKAEEYQRSYLSVKMEVEQRVQNTQPPTGQHSNLDQSALLSNFLNAQGNLASQQNNQAYKLPKVTPKKFSGDIKEYLAFWGVFKHIDEDTTIHKERKFTYLQQFLVEGSRAAELVNSFPPTAENYDKAIEALKTRFGRHELLVEVYVRELLKLVLSNAVAPENNVNLTSLYDKLETQLRALESLGVTTDTCAAMLFPLVESSLPEDLLRIWQRQMTTPATNGSSATANTPKDRLTKLMSFLQAEVDNEERIAITTGGLGLIREPSQKPKTRTRNENHSKGNQVPTATGLLVAKDTKVLDCIFCQGNHPSSDCSQAKKMSYQERQEKAKEKKACFCCLLQGHGARWCPYRGKCSWCGKKHVLLMCRDLHNEKPPDKPHSESNSQKSVKEANLANLSLVQEVFLQTIRVKLYNGHRHQVVRALIDTGSQRSYILESTAKVLEYEALGEQDVVHLLFGGVKSKVEKHNGYRVHLSSLDGSFTCNFVALDHSLICHNIQGVNPNPWLNELRRDNIQLTDVGDTSEPISLLIGADIAGKLLTGRLHDLHNGPTAVETKLGWTLMGKNTSEVDNKVDTAALVVTMFTQQADATELWKLDVLGITDPIEVKTNQILEKEVEERFRQTIHMNEEGRYEVLLPWKEKHPPMEDNKTSAERRLESTTAKLKKAGLYQDYQQVFDEWESEGIIEKVPPQEVEKDAYYMPHRYVLKENSTTKLRPVFDASASGKTSPSLNQCLEIGTNLIELIPAALLRFREKEIGVISDIKKAFLQISIAPSERDVLRFLWWDKEDPSKLVVYRHRRVVFGVSSNPFLLV